MVAAPIVYNGISWGGALSGTQFSQNILADEQSYTLVLETEADLAGLPDFVRAAARADAWWQRIDTLLITGTTTSTCCESTARDASMWGYRTIMVSDGTADALDAHHNHTLGKFLVTFGDVQSTDELVGKLAGQGADSQPVRALAGAK
mgnify:CR=1 FL=1